MINNPLTKGQQDKEQKKKTISSGLFLRDWNSPVDLYFFASQGTKQQAAFYFFATAIYFFATESIKQQAAIIFFATAIYFFTSLTPQKKIDKNREAL